MQGGLGAIPFATTHNSGFLSAYGGSSPLINNGLGSTVSLSQLGLGSGRLVLLDWPYDHWVSGLTGYRSHRPSPLEM